MSRYDRRTTSFSPEGRIFQVEYSMESISQAGFVCGIKTAGGIVLCGERKATAKLMDKTESDKFYAVDEHILLAVAGMASDANLLVDYSRKICNNYREVYNELTPPSFICRRIGDTMQQYTQSGGLRPFGVQLLFASYTEDHGFRLHSVDPSGNITQWHANSFGANSTTAKSELKTAYTEDLTFEEAKKLSVKIFKKCSDTSNVEQLGMFVLTQENGVVRQYEIDDETKQVWCDEIDAENEEDQNA